VKSIGVVVFSYNRPKWLREAVASCSEADEIVVADDGSDYPELIRECGAPIVFGPQRSPQQRMSEHHLHHIAHAAADRLGTDLITWLCDDDLLVSGWLDAVRRAPPADLYIGRVETFTTDPGVRLPLRLDHPSNMTTGNFVHSRSATTRWPDRLLDHDERFVVGLCEEYGPQPPMEEVALLRRLHPHNLSHFRYRQNDLVGKFSVASMEDSA
jgi:glycosyltransferase involved in cell wall biosynthesis